MFLFIWSLPSWICEIRRLRVFFLSLLVDGTLIEAWASMRASAEDGLHELPRGGGRTRTDFQARTIDGRMPRPPSRAGSPGGQDQLCFWTWLVGTASACWSSPACHWPSGSPFGWPRSGSNPAPSGRLAITLGADKAYDAEDFVNELRSMKVTPLVAQNTSGRSSAISDDQRIEISFLR